MVAPFCRRGQLYAVADVEPAHFSALVRGQMERFFVIGASRRVCFNMLKAVRQFSSKLRVTFFCKILVSGLEVLEKFLMNLL